MDGGYHYQGMGIPSAEDEIHDTGPDKAASSDNCVLTVKQAEDILAAIIRETLLPAVRNFTQSTR